MSVVGKITEVFLYEIDNTKYSFFKKIPFQELKIVFFSFFF